MQERQVSIEGTTHPLPDPFIVLATQNPVEFEGTFALPQAQLDRFLLRVRIGYPDEDAERAIARRYQAEAEPLDAIQPVADAARILALRDEVREVRGQRRGRGVRRRDRPGDPRATPTSSSGRARARRWRCTARPRRRRSSTAGRSSCPTTSGRSRRPSWPTGSSSTSTGACAARPRSRRWRRSSTGAGAAVAPSAGERADRPCSRRPPPRAVDRLSR